MDSLNRSVAKAAEAMASLEADKEEAVRRSRQIIRLSKKAIHGMHVGEDPSADMKEMRSAVETLLDVCRNPAILACGLVQDCMCEYCEALILHALVSDSPIPDYEDLGVTPSAWLLGLCDCEGEMRRMVMSGLMNGDMKSAERLFSVMEGMHAMVMSLDIPDAMAPVRRKQDAARGIMDKTRSDMLNAKLSGRLDRTFGHSEGRGRLPGTRRRMPPNGIGKRQGANPLMVSLAPGLGLSEVLHRLPVDPHQRDYDDDEEQDGQGDVDRVILVPDVELVLLIETLDVNHASVGRLHPEDMLALGCVGDPVVLD
ncbi:MAG: hypothetical protein IKH98_02330 [Candidatus Methanomethylophilaceae archaeon]|nr:hypothetical protein [Candidatus Methanomethylophilaceae archaeon]